MNEKRQTFTESLLEHSGGENYWLAERTGKFGRHYNRKQHLAISEADWQTKQSQKQEKQRRFSWESNYSTPINDQLDVLNIDADISMKRQIDKMD